MPINMFTTIDDPSAITGAPLDNAIEGTFASRINGGGEIVGSFDDSSHLLHGFVLSNGSFSTLDDPAQNQPTTDAFGINNVGQIVGSYNDASGKHGFLLSGNTFVPIDDPSADNNALIGTGTAALAIND